MERNSCFFVVVVLVGRHWKLSAIVSVMSAVMMHECGKGNSSSDRPRGFVQGMCTHKGCAAYIVWIQKLRTDSGKNRNRTCETNLLMLGVPLNAQAQH